MQRSVLGRATTQTLDQVIKQAVQQLDHQIESILLAFDQAFAGTPTQLFYRALWRKIDAHYRDLMAEDDSHRHKIIDAALLDRHFQDLMPNIVARTREYIEDEHREEWSSFKLAPLSAELLQFDNEKNLRQAVSETAHYPKESNLWHMYNCNVFVDQNHKNLLGALVKIFKALIIQKFHLLNEISPRIQMYLKFFHPYSEIRQQALVIIDLQEQAKLPEMACDEAVICKSLQRQLDASKKEVLEAWGGTVDAQLANFESFVKQFEREEECLENNLAALKQLLAGNASDRKIRKSYGELAIRVLVVQQSTKDLLNDLQVSRKQIKASTINPGTFETNLNTQLTFRANVLRKLHSEMQAAVDVFNAKLNDLNVPTQEAVTTTQWAHLTLAKESCQKEAQDLAAVLEQARELCQTCAGNSYSWENAKQVLGGATAYSLTQYILERLYGYTSNILAVVIYPFALLGTAFTYVAPSTSNALSSFAGGLWSTDTSASITPSNEAEKRQQEWERIIKLFEEELKEMLTLMQEVNIEAEWAKIEKMRADVKKAAELVQDEKKAAELALQNYETVSKRFISQELQAAIAPQYRASDEKLQKLQERLNELRLLLEPFPSLDELRQTKPQRDVSVRRQRK